MFSIRNLVNSRNCNQESFVICQTNPVVLFKISQKEIKLISENIVKFYTLTNFFKLMQLIDKF